MSPKAGFARLARGLFQNVPVQIEFVAARIVKRHCVHGARVEIYVTRGPALRLQYSDGFVSALFWHRDIEIAHRPSGRLGVRTERQRRAFQHQCRYARLSQRGQGVARIVEQLGVANPGVTIEALEPWHQVIFDAKIANPQVQAWQEAENFRVEMTFQVQARTPGAKGGARYFVRREDCVEHLCLGDFWKGACQWAPPMCWDHEPPPDYLNLWRTTL
jgi:hypothetical protein